MLAVVGQLVLDGGVHVAADSVELQVLIEVFVQQLFGVVRRRFRVQPGIIDVRIEDHRLPIMDLAHRLTGRHGDNRTARHVEVLVVGPNAGEAERLMIGQEDVPGVTPLVSRADRPLIKAVGRDQAAFRCECIFESSRGIDGLGAGVEHGGLREFLGMPGNQPPSTLAELVGPMLARRDERNLFGGCNIVARRIVASDFGGCRQSVEPVNFRPREIPGVASAHAVASVPQDLGNA